MYDADQFCRDEAILPAPPERVWEVLTDLSTWREWWKLINVVPLGSAAIAPGVRYRIDSSRPDRPDAGWTVEIPEVDAYKRIELDYIEGDLIGRAAWELEPTDGGTRLAYVYRGVHAAEPNSAATFERYGTRLHTVAMQVDALSGIARYLRGESLDNRWAAEVQARMSALVAVLDSPDAS